jgi:hypothetical protein
MTHRKSDAPIRARTWGTKRVTTSLTPVGNGADLIQRREPLAAHMISCALIMHR